MSIRATLEKNKAFDDDLIEQFKTEFSNFLKTYITSFKNYDIYKYGKPTELDYKSVKNINKPSKKKTK